MRLYPLLFAALLHSSVFAQVSIGPNVVIGNLPQPGLPAYNPIFTGTLTGPIVQAGNTYLPNFYDWRIVGPVVSGSVDQSANVTNAWNVIGAAHTTGLMTPGTITLNSRIYPTTGMGGYRHEGLGFGGADVGGTTFNWTGGAGFVFELDHQRDASIGNFTLNLNNISGASGIVLEQLSSSSGNISSHDFIHDVTVENLNGGRGIQIVAASGDTGQNDEAHVLWRNTVTSSNYNSGSYCFPSGFSYNVRAIGYYENLTSGCGTAYYLNGESQHVIGGLTEAHNLIVDQTTAPSGSLAAVLFTHDEYSKQGLNVHGNFLFMGNNADVNTPDTSKPWWDFSSVGSGQTVTTIMNSPGGYVGETMVAPPVNGNWVSVGDEFNATSILPTFPVNGYGSSTLVGDHTNVFSNANYVGMHATPSSGTAFSWTNNMGGLFLGANDGQVSGKYSSPPLTLATGYTAGSSAGGCLLVQGGTNYWCYVPFTLMATFDGSNNPTLQLQPSIDPISKTAYAGPLNFDFQTNSNNGLFMAANYAETLHTPATSSEACVAGQFTDDANYHYVCTAPNTWKRVALSTF